MKRLAFTGITVILVLFLAACGGEMSGAPTSGGVEYTDVEYSADGKSITLYLDGVGVPVTAAQRALTRDLAVMSHDYFEVIFQSGTTRARASWEIGQNAGIRGVERSAPGVDYAAVSGATAAVIFVGRKSDMTLLGVGHVIHVNRSTGTILGPTSRSVTFQVVAINTRVTAGGAGAPVGQPGDLSDTNASFLTATGVPGSSGVANTANTRASWTPLDGVQYPMFNLPKYDTVTAGNNTINALYKFFGPWTTQTAAPSEGRPVGSIAMGSAILIDGGVAPIVLTSQIMKRSPRFLSGGQTWYINSREDTATQVAITTTGLTDGALFPATAGIPIVFTIYPQSDGGIFSFTFQIPVYMLTKGAPTNGGPTYETWYIRPGYGTAQYNLDNGVDAGGCVLMGVNVQSIDWLEIFTTGIGFY